MPRQKQAKYKGVRPSGNKWMAVVQKDYKRIYLGTFDTAEMAAARYIEEKENTIRIRRMGREIIYRDWNDFEIGVLVKHYSETGWSFCDEIIFAKTGMRRGMNSIIQKAHKLGLRLTVRREGGFKKGVPHPMKGKKVSPESYERRRKNFFGKGSKTRANSVQDVVIRRRKSSKRSLKYIRINSGQWKALHRHTWEQHNGPIPKGHVISFKDGDSLNCDIDNLEMIAHREYFKVMNANYHKILRDEFVFRIAKRSFGMGDISFEEALSSGLIEVWRNEIEYKRLLKMKKNETKSAGS